MKPRFPIRTGLLAGVLFLVPSMVACSSHSPAEPDPREVAEEPPQLAPGDAISLVFWREPDLNGEYPIDESGTAVLPILGPTVMVGHETTDLKESLNEAYAQQLRNQHVQITFMRRVRVLGAVQSPGMYFVDPTMTLGDALAQAGGATSAGKLDGIQILRGDQAVRSDLDAQSLITEQVRSGDQIMVPERSWLSRNTRVVLGGVGAGALVIIAGLFGF